LGAIRVLCFQQVACHRRLFTAITRVQIPSGTPNRIIGLRQSIRSRVPTPVTIEPKLERGISSRIYPNASPKDRIRHKRAQHSGKGCGAYRAVHQSPELRPKLDPILDREPRSDPIATSKPSRLPRPQTLTSPSVSARALRPRGRDYSNRC